MKAEKKTDEKKEKKEVLEAKEVKEKKATGKKTKATEEKPTEEKTKAAEKEAAKEKVAEKKPAAKKTKAAEKAPADEKAAEKKPAAKKAKAAEKAPAEEKAAEKKPAEKKTKAAEKAPAEEKAAEKKPAAKKTKAAEKAPAEEKAAEKKPAEKKAKAAEKAPAEEKPAEKKPAEKKAKAAEKAPAEEKAAEDKAAEKKPAEKKPSKKKSVKKSAKVLESILDLNANNIWDYDEYAIADAWERERKEEDFSISEMKLLNTIRLAFEVVHYNPDDEREAAKYEKGDWAKIVHCKEAKGCVAIRRKTIERITDLSYENIRHISTAMLLELINRNFGGGWDSISLAIRDIIETGFEISTTQLPQSRIHIPGGTLDKKVAQGFEVLEIPKGTWVEAIFAKKKDPVEKIHMEMPDREYDEDGNLIPLPDDMNDKDDLDADETLDNDDTYFSSLTPEAEMSDLEAEGLAIEDVGEGEEEE